MRIWNRATGEPWAMTRDALATLLEVAARKNQSPEVVAAKLGRELQNTHQMTIEQRHCGDSHYGCLVSLRQCVYPSQWCIFV